MIDREAVVDLLVRHEGERARVYDDATGRPLRTGDIIQGIPTIGIGRNLMDVGISPDEARYLLMNDIERAIVACKGIVPDFKWLGSTRQMVLLDMAVNLGAGGLAKFQKMLAALARRDFDAAAEEMLSSRWAHQVGGRADRLAGAMRAGEFPD